VKTREAQSIVDETNQKLDADLATLFAVDGSRLVLAAPLVLGGKRAAADPAHQYNLSDAAKQGITALVATSKQPLFIDSYDELLRHPAHAGKWDRYIYGDAGPSDPKTGFGCLMASPVIANSQICGVFKVERRRYRPVFTEAERRVFTAVAGRLGKALTGLSDASEPAPVADFVLTDQLKQVQAGFASLNLAPEIAGAALQNLARWLDGVQYSDYHAQLEWLIDTKNWSVLLSSFYQILPFGTGGRRGPVGIGTNRFNPETLKLSLLGHIKYLLDLYPDKDLKDLSVVIAYDVRAFHDLRRVYNPDLPNQAILGISSKDFAHICADFYMSYGVGVHILPQDSKTYLSTPELSYSIRRLGASGGLNISASHNHPDDNGGKFFGAHGGQEVPPNDQRMADLAEFENPSLSLADVRPKGQLRFIAPDLHRDFIDLAVKQSLDPTARGARIVFTPLHGTGGATAGEALNKAGFHVDPVAEQSIPDGSFPTVPYRAPNPEVPESMAKGVELAKRVDADIVLATDPDADRIGLVSVVRNGVNKGAYRLVTGNEIASILTYYKLDSLRRQNRLPKRPLVLKTEVTTNLMTAITKDFGGTIMGDFLVGFKYLGDVLNRIEYTHELDFALSDFVIAAEESLGILVTPEMRDKDATGAAILLAELASELRAANRTIVDYLDDIYLRYGYFANRVISMVMSGAEGSANIQKIQAAMRSQPPSSVGGHRVIETIDHRNENGIYGKRKSDSDWEARNVLVFRLESDAKVTIRPSGTEPKNKVYLEVKSSPLGIERRDALAAKKAEVDALSQRIGDDFTKQMLAIIGVELPDYALRISGLVNLEKKISFVRDFIPELEKRVSTNDPGIGKWIDESLWSYGEDGRGLVADAIAAYVETERQNNISPERIQQLEILKKLFPKTGGY
jgi:phosphoglucomutase